MAGTMSVSGLISGLDTETIISKVIAIARRPQALVTIDKETAQKKLAVWQDINTRVLALKMSADSIANPTSFQKMTAASSDEDVAMVTASSEATEGVYALKVTSKANANQISSAETYDSINSVIGTGTVDITTANGKHISVTIDNNNNTISGLRDSINKNTDSGVTASLMNTGSSTDPKYKLVLTSKETGIDNKISEVNVNLTGGTTPTFNLNSPIQAATDATVEIGNGDGKVTINKSSNIISDVIPGVTINILKADTENQISINVSKDISGVKSSIQSFVSKYNDIMSTIDEQFKFYSDTSESGLLMGNFQLQSLQMDLGSMVGRNVNGITSKYNALSSVGITTGSDGLLSVDESKLTEALQSHSSDASKLFSYNLETGSSYVKLIAQSSDTKESSAGGWNLNITQVATRSESVAGVAMNGTLDADETITINDKTISLKSGWTLSQAIGEINKRSGETGVAAFETVRGDDHFLSLRAVNYGSKADFTAYSSRSNQTTGGSGLGVIAVSAANGGGENGQGTGTKGVDVAGNIYDGTSLVELEGNGQILSAPFETTSSIKGLVIQAQNTSIPSEAINMTYTKGIGSALSDTLTAMTSSKGLLTSVQDSLNTEIKDADTRIADMETSILAQQDRLTLQFNAMETQLAKLQDQGKYVSAMLGSSSSSK